MIPKFIHLQSHFIHLYFLTEFEIIFYIFYVMPYEKTIFKRVVKDMVQNVKDLIDDDAPFSIVPSQPSACDAYQTELDDANAELWNYCVIYLGAINALLVVVFIHDVWKVQRTYSGTSVHSPKHNSKSNLVAFGSNPNFISLPDAQLSIEMTNKKNDEPSTKAIEVEIKDDIPLSFHVYYWRNSGFVAEFIKTTEFIVLVAIFEYVFFVSIVDKFKIANSHTLLCDGMELV
jgi:hypothetical protein